MRGIEAAEAGTRHDRDPSAPGSIPRDGRGRAIARPRADVADLRALHPAEHASDVRLHHRNRPAVSEGRDGRAVYGPMPGSRCNAA
jgi:hypothetical protein